MTLHEKHMQMIDAVNNAVNREDYWTAYCKLWGWRDGVADAGGRLDYIAADLEQFDRGYENTPMCCGVFIRPIHEAN
jgi:hypothetical protein